MMNCNREHISALMDGGLERTQVDATLASMQGDAALECLHVYHVIGDVLRAPELGAWAGDAMFVARLRQRLPEQSPPQTMTPSLPEPPTMVASVPGAAQTAANDGVFRWKLVAGLASFAAVAVMGWAGLGRLGPQAPTAGPQVAQLAPPAAASDSAEVPLTQPRLVAESTVPATGTTPVMLRDPDLDQLLAAHRQAAGLSAFGSGPGFMRNATFEGPAR